MERRASEMVPKCTEDLSFLIFNLIKSYSFKNVLAIKLFLTANLNSRLLSFFNRFLIAINDGKVNKF